MSWYQFPTLTVADDLGVFPLLADSPSSTEEVAITLKITPRAAEAMLGVLSGLGFLWQRGSKFFITETTRNFLLPTSPYY